MNPDKFQRKYLVAILIVIVSAFAYSQKHIISTKKLTFQIDSVTGGVYSIISNDDKLSMNWILNSDGSQYPWQTADFGWGMVHCMLNGDTLQWNKHIKIERNRNIVIATYTGANILLEVSRKAEKNGAISESYRFVNLATKSISLSDIAVCTPFNDNYPDSRTCVDKRCNAHIHTGGSDSWVFAQRMGGEAPHIGLILTEGSLKSYEILNRSHKIYPWHLSGSNSRGTIALNPEDMMLEAGQSYTLSWKVITASDRNNFFSQALQEGLVLAEANKYVTEMGEIPEVIFTANRKLRNVTCTLNGNKTAFVRKGNKVIVAAIPAATGEQVLSIAYDNKKKSIVNLMAVRSIPDLFSNRAGFIVANQQMNDTADIRYGAYMVYDNETKRIYLNNDSRKSSDLNEGRERVGMGVFLAMYLQKNPNILLQQSLLRYVYFVRTKLQLPDYTVLNGINDTKKRVYNYPWVAQLYLEMFHLTANESYLRDFYHTARKYFKDGKHRYYGIGFPVQDGLQTLRKEGWINEHDSLLNDCRLTADNYVATGLDFPKFEVNYEQSIVAPSVVFLLEVYQQTNDQKYLTEAEKQLKALESFAGNQPDYRLNEIAIRHWDGYWFGKYQFWGDIMPHYWSAISSEAFARYALISGDNTYMQRAETIVRANLCNFFEDGSASCAYVYPAKINGKKAAFFDPFANDQDWALVFYLKFLRLKRLKS